MKNERTDDDDGQRTTTAGDAGEQDEARSSSLDISSEELRELSSLATTLVADYFAEVSDLPVFPDTSAARVAARLRSTLPDEGVALERLMEDCRAVIHLSRHNGHPRFFGYVASPSTPIGAYADLIASALNSNVTSWRSSPAATEIEREVVRWLASLVGYSEDGHGLLTSGGSMANLNALYVAHRAAAGRDASRAGLWNTSAPMTLYASEQVHLSIPKAADVLGLGREQARLVETDEHYRLDARRLREKIESDKQRGLRPFCIVASAGTVNTGAIDPLMEIARVAKDYSLWFHVDGAYGALGAMDASKRALFAGLELADSVSLDPHKWLYAPVDCGCLLFRDAESVRQAFASASEADYIKVHEAEAAEAFAFWDYGVELSRRFRALKIWLMLRYYGARRVSASVAEDNRLAAYLAARVNEADDFELLAPVELSICCFRYLPPGVFGKLERASETERAALDARLNKLNERIMHLVQRGGRAYLSNASLGGRYSLRACITNFRTTRADLRQTLDIIRDAAAHVLNDEDERLMNDRDDDESQAIDSPAKEPTP
ncbi:MAG: aromatic-L-amino-acid/L-tryptophan decarboxylase [Blastocatellia bacterium]|jgi:glutamate/tyrosine decarboxylase-like PLP-dependent enzyme|nr:aromatic-L-amino-acid/L-tryptophan decarboxylase [Blastocatellia bacterium]